MPLPRSGGRRVFRRIDHPHHGQRRGARQQQFRSGISVAGRRRADGFYLLGNADQQYVDGAILFFRGERACGMDGEFHALGRDHARGGAGAGGAHYAGSEHQRRSVRRTCPRAPMRFPARPPPCRSGSRFTLSVTINGSYDLMLSTPSGLLSFDAYSNKESTVQLTLTNLGNTDLSTSISLPARPRLDGALCDRDD